MIDMVTADDFSVSTEGSWRRAYRLAHRYPGTYLLEVKIRELVGNIGFCNIHAHRRSSHHAGLLKYLYLPLPLRLRLLIQFPGLIGAVLRTVVLARRYITFNAQKRNVHIGAELKMH